MQSKTAEATKVPTQEEVQAYIEYVYEVLQTPIQGATRIEFAENVGNLE